MGFCSAPGQQYATNYRATFTLGDTNIVLRDGLPVANVHVQSNKTVWFYYQVPNGNTADVRIVVTALSGDPDIVASFTNPQPYCYFQGFVETCTAHDYLENDFGDETLVIPKSALPTTANASLYIGIFGFFESYFSIVATQQNGSIPDHTLLFDGQPQAGSAYPIMVCPNRDPMTKLCPPANSTTAYGSYYTFVVPAGHFLVGDAYVMVDKVCGNESGVYCPPAHLMVRGTERISVWRCVSLCHVLSCGGCVMSGMDCCVCRGLQTYISGCAVGNCSSDAMYPSQFKADTSFQLSTAGAYHLFRDSCVHNPNNQDCIFFVGVFVRDAEDKVQLCVVAVCVCSIVECGSLPE